LPAASAWVFFQTGLDRAYHLDHFLRLRNGTLRVLNPSDMVGLVTNGQAEAGNNGPGSRFERSISVLREAKRLDPSLVTKSGLMLGLGERREEVVEVLERLRDAGCEIVTIGQYLQPKREKLDVVEYVEPRVFDQYREIGDRMGFRAVFSGPFVRSSYMADLVAAI